MKPGDDTDVPDAGLTGQFGPDLAELFTLFKARGSPAPTIIRNPDISDVKNPTLLQFAELIAGLPASKGQTLAADFTIQDFHSVQDWMLLIDVEESGKIFRYRHYGDGIADVWGKSLVGQTSLDFDNYISRFFTTIYRIACAVKCPILTIHEPPSQVFAKTWERLIIPLYGPSGEVVQFVVANVPDNELRPGLEVIPDPVLIADGDQVVRFANRAARELFGRQRMYGENRDLFDFAGIDFQIRQTPTELAKSRAVHDVVSLVVRDTMLERFLLTVSGTFHRGHAFYVITLRPDALATSDQTY